MTNLVTFNVSLGKNSYPIYIGNHLLNKLSRFIPNSKYSRIILVTDKNIVKNNLIKFDLSKNYNLDTLVYPAGEKTKSFQFLNDVIEKILRLGIDRNSLIICLGGGVLGDLVGLASSLVLRGVDLIQIPTTLLSQVDSSVGGKTGINSKYGKNLIGTFKQPKSVIISTDVLKTLTKREIISGYAEILKYSFIKSKPFFNWLKKNGRKVISLQNESCIYAIKKSCSIKSKIVSIDEKENGVREILNFGHTFGHAIESITGYSNKINHGESIFIGMSFAIKFSIFLKLCKNKVLFDYQKHLEEIGISSSLKHYNININVEEFIRHIKFDKKIKKNKIKFILLNDVGKPVRFFLDNETLLENFLKGELK